MAALARKRASIGLGVIALAVVIAVLALFVAPALQPTPASAAPKTFVYQAKGAGAGAVVVTSADPAKWWSTCATYVEVMRGGTQAAVETYLVYYAEAWNPDVEWTMVDKETGETTVVFGQCELAQAGFGPIPNSAFQGSGKSYSLNVDTSADLPGFTRDLGLGGVIHLAWQGTNYWKSSITGTETTTYARSSTRFVGPSSMTSADASGTFMGASLTASPTNADGYSDAMIRSNQAVTIEHTIGG